MMTEEKYAAIVKCKSTDKIPNPTPHYYYDVTYEVLPIGAGILLINESNGRKIYFTLDTIAWFAVDEEKK